MHFSDWDVERIAHRLRCGHEIAPEILRAAGEQVLTRGLDRTAQLEFDLAEAEEEATTRDARIDELEGDLENKTGEAVALEKENKALKAKALELEEIKAAGAKFLSLCTPPGPTIHVEVPAHAP